MQISSRRQIPIKSKNTTCISKNPFSIEDNKIKRDISSFLLKCKNRPFHPNLKASTLKKVQKKKIQPKNKNLSSQNFSNILELGNILISKIDKTNSLCLVLSGKLDNISQEIPNGYSELKNTLNLNFRKTFRKINRLNNLIRVFTESMQNNNHDENENENRKKIYFVDKACITVNFIVSKAPNENGIANAKEKLENFLCEGNNLFIDKTIVLDDNADDSNDRNENPSQDQNNLENGINNINIINQDQLMEEDPKIEDHK